jgi:hypothetical protein
MKYVYGLFAVLSLLGGVALLLLRGLSVETMLTLIFGAVCAVAAEVSEVGEKLLAQMSVATRGAGSEMQRGSAGGIGPSGEKLS